MKKALVTIFNVLECTSLPFESGVLSLETNSFDLVFTSPFFDYEICFTSNAYLAMNLIPFLFHLFPLLLVLYFLF